METTTSPPTTYSRRFYGWWFALFTIVSMVLNGLHAFMFSPRAWSQLHPDIAAWLAVDGSQPSWFAPVAVGVALIPPIGLACATHALVTPDPNTTSGRGTGARTTTWIIALAALTLSTVMITDLVRMLLGVPIALAILVPLIVDVSIVAAVLRLEIRRRGHAAEAHIPDDVEQPEQHESLVEQTHDAAEGAPQEQTSGAVEVEPQERPVAPRDALGEAPQAQSLVPHGPPLAQIVERPKVTREPRQGPVKRPVEQFIVDGDAEELAARIATETTISQPVMVIAEVLTRAAAGESQRKIAAAMPDVSATTAGRILTAARELSADQEPELVAV